MFGLGLAELLIIVAVLLVVFNRRLPDLGESFGAAVRKFKRAVNQPDEIDITPHDDSKKNANNRSS
jgi:sec-independent protein translocase protein TatA